MESLVFSPNGSILAVSGQAQFGPCIQLWNFPNHTLRKTIRNHALRKIYQGHNIYETIPSPGTSISFSLDGKLLLIANTNSETIGVWNVETGYEQELPLANRPRLLSPNGQTLAVASDYGGVELINLRTDEREVVLVGEESERLPMRYSKKEARWIPTNEDLAFSFSRDGNKITIVNRRDWIKVWDVIRHCWETEIDVGRRFRKPSAIVLLDETAFAIQDARGVIELWNLDEGREWKKVHQKTVYQWYSRRNGIFSSDQTTVITSTGFNVTLWDVKAVKKQLGTISLNGDHGESIGAVSFLPDDRTIAIAMHASTSEPWWTRKPYVNQMITPKPMNPYQTVLILWDPAKDTLDIEGHGPGKVEKMAISADGSRLAMGMDDGSILFWDSSR